MKRVVKYTALDPYYSDIIQTYIGIDECEVNDIQWETEEAMQGENLFTIYKAETIYESGRKR